MCFKNIGDMLDHLPKGFFDLPLFELKTKLSPKLNKKIEANSTRRKIKKQDKKLLSEMCKEKEYLEVMILSLPSFS